LKRSNRSDTKKNLIRFKKKNEAKEMIQCLKMYKAYRENNNMRIERVNQVVKRELGNMILFGDLNDPRVKISDDCEC